jgi:hypothetical protein
MGASPQVPKVKVINAWKTRSMVIRAYAYSKLGLANIELCPYSNAEYASLIATWQGLNLWLLCQVEFLMQ